MAAEIALKIAPVLEDRLRNNEPIHGADELCASDDDEDSEDEKKHEKLLKEIRSLSSSGKKRVASQRSEPHKQVSEFHLSSVQDGTQQVDLNDLIGSLNNTNEYGSLKKKLDSMQRNSNTLDVPLPKPEVQKIQRTIAYGETKKDIEKWAPTVKKNREAEHLSFPLKPYRPPVLSLSGLAVKFKPRTPLEEEVAAVLRGSSHVLERKNKELTEEEEKALLGMDLEEAKERRHELQKLRALQSYYEAKCRRMKKIKSKKYHRVKRKAEKRAAEKRVEEDPQAEDDKDALEKVEKLRAEERMSLKHRNTSKWAKHLITKAGKNADAKKLLQEQLRISRNLTQKAAESESDEEMEAPTQEQGLEDNEEESDSYGNLVTSEDNPWKLDTSGAGFHSLETSNNVDDDSSIKLHRLQPIRTQEADNEDEEDSEQLDVHERETEEEFELQPVSVTQRSTKKTKKQHFEEAKIRKKRKPKDTGDEVTVKKKKQSDKSKRNSKHILNEAKKSRCKTQHEIKMVNISEDTKDDGTGSTGQRNSFTNGKRAGNDASAETVNSKSKEIRVDPTKIFRIEDQGNVGSDSLQQKRIDIQQAFANDDVVEEFIQEKKEIEEASTPKDVDLSLPGWGSWAGAGIKPSVKKKEKFIKKADPAPPRKDKNLAHVIINEEKSQLFSRNQVSSVPHPYGNHVQFERSVRNPVGKHWNTSTTFNQLTKPRVSTLIGTIIEPMRATKEIKRSHPEDRKNKKLKGTSGIAMHS